MTPCHYAPPSPPTLPPPPLASPTSAPSHKSPGQASPRSARQAISGLLGVQRPSWRRDRGTGCRLRGRMVLSAGYEPKRGSGPASSEATAVTRLQKRIRGTLTSVSGSYTGISETATSRTCGRARSRRGRRAWQRALTKTREAPLRSHWDAASQVVRRQTRCFDWTTRRKCGYGRRKRPARRRIQGRRAAAPRSVSALTAHRRSASMLQLSGSQCCS